MKRSFLRATVVAALLGIAVPATAAVPVGLSGYADTARADGEWGAVLNLNRFALEALDQGHAPLAARALDASLARIDAIYADSESAAKARSLWSAEGVKDFKGEPYERAMAYYYRGLLYAAEGDYQNARASFRSAEYQDTISASETFAGDFGLMSLLAGWASACEGDAVMAEDFYASAANQQQGLVAPAKGASTLVLVESGAAPAKTTAGQYHEALTLSKGVNPYEKALLDGRELVVLGDVSYQATTRGGRQVDQILNGKASFKTAASTVADLGNLGMQLAAGSGDFGNTFGASAAVGIGAAILGGLTKPKADIRSWDNLPDRIHGEFVTAAGAHPSVSLVEAGGGTRTLERPVIDAVNGQCRLVVYRSQVPGTLPAQAANNLSERERRKVLKRNAERDRSFQAELEALLQDDADDTSSLTQASL